MEIFSCDNPTTPPDETVKNGVVAMYVIDPADIRNVKAVDGVIKEIKMKRRGTYNGKRYNRDIHHFKFQ